MKRLLNKTEYTLSHLEKEKMWHAVRLETHGVNKARRHDNAFKPALALSGVVAMITFVVVWQLGERQIEMRQFKSNDNDSQLVAVSPPSPRMGVIGERPKLTAGVSVSLPARDIISGQVRDQDTGEAIAHARVLVPGSAVEVITNAKGEFELENQVVGEEVDLTVQMLSYEPIEVTIAVPTAVDDAQVIEMVPVIVEQLQAFDVEGPKYMVDVRSGMEEHTLSSTTFEKYATESAEEAVSKSAGVVSRAGEVVSRLQTRSDQALTESVPLRSVTGGTTPPNGAQVELMYFESAGVNPFVATEDDALSTFAVDVDNASWTLTRNYLSRGMLPPKEAIRVEEFVNAFDAGWPGHKIGRAHV